MNNLLADIDLGPLRGRGPLGLENRDPWEATGIFTAFLTGVIGLLTIIAIIWFVILFITGAIGIMTAMGDKAAIETARKKIYMALIGLVMVIIAIFVIDLFGYLIGIPNILNIVQLVNSILVP